MVKVSERCREKIEEIVKEILDSDLSDQELQRIADEWVECAVGVMVENRIDYSREDVDILKTRFLERLEKIREYTMAEKLQLKE
ncbi:MAG: hypothetical protein NZ929_01095 [Aigarchaeota archaeon]|nr:hypothetical protein [Aigarchaeota archaeon]MCX8192252.1 hypothetical protein [Nitrososphaeria archaeon]MDW7986140.1 hypothetical protein [Nitrososphaerota archaeon]